jgi:hypothetical protein
MACSFLAHSEMVIFVWHIKVGCWLIISGVPDDRDLRSGQANCERGEMLFSVSLGREEEELFHLREKLEEIFCC